jgi:hypothetical protein
MKKIEQQIDPFTLRALRLTMDAGNGYPLGVATGFIVRRRDVPFLVTNLHVVSGRHPDTGEQICQPLPPDFISIYHHVTEQMRAGHGVWTVRTERLVDDSIAPLWHDHPAKDLRRFPYPETWGERVVDVAVVQLSDVSEVELYTVELPDSEPDVLIRPGLPVHIVGFPFGHTAEGYFPLWKTGHIASDFDAPANGRVFFVDASTRTGMSGSPVVFRPLGPYLSKTGEVLVGDGSKSVFLGIYSGRVHPESDIGIVWRTSVIAEVLDAALGSAKAVTP